MKTGGNNREQQTWEQSMWEFLRMEGRKAIQGRETAFSPGKGPSACFGIGMTGFGKIFLAVMTGFFFPFLNSCVTGAHPMELLRSDLLEPLSPSTGRLSSPAAEGENNGGESVSVPSAFFSGGEGNRKEHLLRRWNILGPIPVNEYVRIEDELIENESHLDGTSDAPGSAFWQIRTWGTVTRSDGRLLTDFSDAYRDTLFSSSASSPAASGGRIAFYALALVFSSRNYDSVFAEIGFDPVVPDHSPEALLYVNGLPAAGEKKEEGKARERMYSFPLKRGYNLILLKYLDEALPETEKTRRFALRLFLPSVLPTGEEELLPFSFRQ